MSGYEEFAYVPVDVAHVRMFAQLNFQWRFLIRGSCTQLIISVHIKGTVSQDSNILNDNDLKLLVLFIH